MCNLTMVMVFTRADDTGNVGERETSLECHVDITDSVSNPSDDIVSSLESHGIWSWGRDRLDGQGSSHGMYRGSRDSNRGTL